MLGPNLWGELSPRGQAIVTLLATPLSLGFSAKELGAEVGRSPHWVSRHVAELKAEIAAREAGQPWPELPAGVELVGIREGAAILGINGSTFSNRAREDPGFPPVARFGQSPVWRRDVLEGYARSS